MPNETGLRLQQLGQEDLMKVMVWRREMENRGYPTFEKLEFCGEVPKRCSK
jgi:hypothetical protein